MIQEFVCRIPRFDIRRKYERYVQQKDKKKLPVSTATRNECIKLTQHDERIGEKVLKCSYARLLYSSGISFPEYATFMAIVGSQSGRSGFSFTTSGKQVRGILYSIKQFPDGGIGRGSGQLAHLIVPKCLI